MDSKFAVARLKIATVICMVFQLSTKKKKKQKASIQISLVKTISLGKIIDQNEN